MSTPSPQPNQDPTSIFPTITPATSIGNITGVQGIPPGIAAPGVQPGPSSSPAPSPTSNPSANPAGGGGGAGSSSGSSSPVTGASVPTGTDPSAQSGNFLTDFGNFLHGILSDIPGVGKPMAEAVAVWMDVIHALAVPIAHFLSAFRPGQAYRFLFYILTLITGLAAYRAYGGSLPGRPSHSDNLPLALLLSGAALMFSFMAFRPWPSLNGAALKPGAYLWDELHGTPPPRGPVTTTADVQEVEGVLDVILGLWVVIHVAGTIKDVAEAAQDAKNAIFGWWGNLF